MAIISFHDPNRHTPRLTPTQKDQLHIYSEIKRVINAEKTDIPALITEYLFSCNEEMMIFLKQVNWDIESFCLNRSLAPYFHSFKNQTTSLSHLPYAFKNNPLIERVKSALRQIVNLKKISVSTDTDEIPKWDYQDGLLKNRSYDPQITAEFYQWLIDDRKIEEISIYFPITLNVLKVLTSKTDLITFSLTPPPDNYGFFDVRSRSVGPTRITECIIPLNQLRRLALRVCGLTTDLAKQITDSCRQLEELDLSANKITQIDFFLPHLTTLDLSDNRLTEEQTFHSLTQSLVAINFTKCLRTENAPAFVEAVCNLPKLRSLQLMCCPLTEDELKRLFKIKDLSILEIGLFSGSYALCPLSRKLREQRPSIHLKHLYSDIELPDHDRESVDL